MTLEKECLIEIGDVLAVHYECGDCHAAIVVPIEKVSGDLATSHAITPCRYCGKPSGIELGTQEFRNFMHFNDSISALAKSMEGRRMKMRLRIKCGA